MRITIEPTAGNVPGQHKVVVENKFDDTSMVGVWELLMHALLGWGFSQETIDRFINQEAGNGA